MPNCAYCLRLDKSLAIRECSLTRDELETHHCPKLEIENEEQRKMERETPSQEDLRKWFQEK